MDVTGAVSGATGLKSSGAGRGMDDLSSEDFFSLLIAELQYQDPFKPMDNAQMLDQLASIRDMEMSMNLSTSLQSLTRQQNYGTASSLIGKHVVGEVSNGNGDLVVKEGIVTGVRFEPNGKIILELDTGDQLPLEAVTHVSSADEMALAIGTDTASDTNGQTGDQATT